MSNRLEICNLAGDIQDSLVSFVRRVNDEEIGCMSRDIEVDGYMLIFHEQETWQKFVECLIFLEWILQLVNLMESLKHGILTLNFRMELANKKPIEAQFNLGKRGTGYGMV